MKIVENSVKCGEIIFDHKFYFKTTKCSSNFVPVDMVGFCQKNLSWGWGFSTKKLVAQG